MAKETLAVQSVADMSLPQGWVNAVLSDFAHIEAGQSPPGESYNDSGEGTPFFQGKAEFGGVYPAVRKWTTQPTKFAEKDDILLSIRAPVGPTNLSPDRVAIGRGLAGVHPQGGVPSLFVLYGLRSRASELASQATGTTFSAISADVVRSLPFPLPPLREQERIVAKLEELFSRLDAGLEAVKRTQALLKRYRQSVLRDAVTGELSREWRERCGTDRPDAESAERLLARILAERRARWEQGGRRGKYVEPEAPDTAGLPELPRGWVWTSIEQIIPPERKAMKTGPFGTLLAKSDYRAEGIPIVGIENIGPMQFSRGFKKYVSAQKFEELSEYEVHSGDIIISRSGTVGEVCVIPLDQGRMILSTNLLKLTLADGGMEPMFFCLIFNGSPTVLTKVSELCAGSTRDFLNQGILKSLSFPLPPLSEQTYIVSEVERRLSIIDDMTASLAAEVRRAESLRQSILHRAFTGRLVPQDPTDEPASELLRRIQAERGAAGSGGRGRAKVSDAASASQEGHRRPRKAKIGEQGGDTATAGQKRGRGRPRKSEAIPEANTVEEAIRLMEARKVERAEGTRMVTLFGED